MKDLHLCPSCVGCNFPFFSWDEPPIVAPRAIGTARSHHCHNLHLRFSSTLETSNLATTLPPQLFHPFKVVVGDTSRGISVCRRQLHQPPCETLVFLLVHMCSSSSFHAFFISWATQDPPLLAQLLLQSEAPLEVTFMWELRGAVAPFPLFIFFLIGCSSLFWVVSIDYEECVVYADSWVLLWLERWKGNGSLFLVFGFV